MHARTRGPAATGQPDTDSATGATTDGAAQAPLHVVVVTYNSTAPLAGLLPTLDAGLVGTRWRMTVVDNASADGTVDMVRAARPEAQVIEMGRNAGYSAAINAAAATATPDEHLLVLNPDVRLLPGCGEALLATLDDPAVGVAVPRLLDAAGRTWPSLRHAPSVTRAWAEALLGGNRAARHGLSELIPDGPTYASPADVDWATGAVLAISARCRAAVGDWDESFFLYSEEVDYCARVRDHGFVVRYEPAAVAEHDSGPYGPNLTLWRLVVRNRIVHFARRHPGLRAHAFRAGTFVGQALRAPRSAAGRAGAAEAWSTSLREVREPGVIWFAAQDWWYHNRAHSDFQLMQEVARGRPVLLVNSLGLRMPRRGVSSNPGRRISRKLRSMAKLVRRPVPGLPQYHVMTPVMIPAYGSGIAARLNAWSVRQQVRIVSRLIGVGQRPYVAATIPTAWPVLRPLRRSALVYNRSDQHSAFPEADQQRIAELEHALMRHADRVLYVSHELMRADGDAVGDRGVFLGHGVDLDHFSRGPGAGGSHGARPAELADVPGPIMGFFGGIDDYVVDLELLASTARALPEVSMVLVGDATCPLDDLLALPNVHWLGFQPYSRIPELGRTFDVALMPWLDNEWIRFANPIKLKEYLALGLPVVSTHYPEVEHEDGTVAVARTPEEFAALVREALDDPPDPAALRAAVESSSWSSRAQDLMNIATTARRA
ncbi:glycosyltransferase [Actinotalea sp. BY-33]|uniref:Glycosyltransferase n=1 Tax=Actinotalea soli TaxID=2819234 RepID=A0A939LQ77_9CELL|nr:glycosyltransferase [Actinotalea soli]MBO1751978.1 glycosyltransferase [Actinotalea soli]